MPLRNRQALLRISPHLNCLVYPCAFPPVALVPFLPLVTPSVSELGIVSGHCREPGGASEEIQTVEEAVLSLFLPSSLSCFPYRG
jgi:hypothetical protein